MQEALDLSFDRLLMMTYKLYHIMKIGGYAVRSFDGSYYLRKRKLAFVELGPSYPAWGASVSREDEASQPAVDLRKPQVCVSMTSDTTRRGNIYSRCTDSDLNPFSLIRHVCKVCDQHW